MRIKLIAVILALRATTLSAQGERFFYYTDREDAYRSLVAHIDQITVLGPQSYTVDSLGTFFGGVDARVLRLAKDHHVKVMPLFVNEGFNQPALRRLLKSIAALSVFGSEAPYLPSALICGISKASSKPKVKSSGAASTGIFFAITSFKEESASCGVTPVMA